MTLKILQLNIFKAKFLDRIVELVKQNDFDILQFQEMTGGKMSNGGLHVYPEEMHHDPGIFTEKFAGIDSFQYLKDNLMMDGQLVKTNQFVHDADSYSGNATFFKNNIKLFKSEIIWLKDFFRQTPDDTDIANFPRAALICTFEIGNKPISFINTHLAWGPTPEDKDYKLKQAEILYQYITTVQNPFIVTGDFNVTPDTKLVEMFDKIGRNLTKENKIVNTINFNIHPATKLFPPGLAVDFIFVPNRIEVKEFKLIDKPDLSDHYGLEAEISN